MLWHVWCEGGQCFERFQRGLEGGNGSVAAFVFSFGLSVSCRLNGEENKRVAPTKSIPVSKLS